MAETPALPTDSSPKPELPDIVQRYLNGEPVSALAKEAGVARMTIYRWLLSSVGDEHYPEIVTHALIARIADADQELDESRDNVTVTRAYAKCRLTRQDFERRRPKLYGPKQEITHQGVTVVVNRSTPQPVVVEASGHEVKDVNASQPVEMQALSKTEQLT